MISKKQGMRIRCRKPRLIKPILREIMLDLYREASKKKNHKRKNT
jgi:hypothetical protein